jgi:hypothetical protein
MDDRAHLFDGELLLCSQRSTPAVIVRAAFMSLREAIVIGVIGSLLLFVTSASLALTPATEWYVPFFLIGYIVGFALRFSVWREAAFRITNDRILLSFPGKLIRMPLRTIKWPQYQESYVGSPTVADLFFRSRPLVIRFGTADGSNQTSFPSLRFAHDLKHYLDKADSAFRRGEILSVHPFIAKPKWHRY